MAKKLARFIQDQLRWVEMEYPWPRDGELPSDLLKDLSTTNNKLSTYEFEDDESFLRIASAFAYTRNKREKLDFIVFDADDLKDLNISPEKSGGITGDVFVNEKHWDLVNLSAEDIVKFAHYLSQRGETKRVLEETLFQGIYKSLSASWISKGVLQSKILEGLKKWTIWT